MGLTDRIDLPPRGSLVYRERVFKNGVWVWALQLREPSELGGFAFPPDTLATFPTELRADAARVELLKRMRVYDALTS